MTTHLSRSDLRRSLRITTALAGGALLAVSPAPAQIVPTGPTPVVGNPTITPTPSPTPGAIDLEVSLDQNRTIINWTSFNIGQDDSVNFKDGFSAGANALAVLNRDLSGNLSQIDGSLLSDANVAVYLLNTNGITFGAGANVNVGALIASTLGLTDADFLDGASYNFTGAGTAGIDILGGTINGASAVSFIGHFVNQAAGTVTGGDVAFVAASDVTMANEPGSPLALTINQGSAVAAPIVVGGTVNGQNVYVGMATKAAVTDAVLSISGVVTATTATATDRGIVLAAGTSAAGVTVDGSGDTGGNAKVAITGALTAGDGGTAANSANVEIRALDMISGSAAITAADNLTSSSANGNVSHTGALESTGGDTTLSAAAGTVEASGGLAVGGDYSVTAQDFLAGALGPNFGAGTTNDFTITDTAGGITLGSLSAPGTLTVTALNGGTISLAGGVLASTNEAVALNAAAGIAVAGASTIDSAAGQTLTGPIALGADLTLASSGGGAITLAGSVDGGHDLVVNTSGTTSFSGSVGATTALASLTTDAGGATAINGGSVTTIGDQSYGDAVTLGADTTLNGATGTFASTVTGAGNDLALNFSGTTIIDGDFTGIANLASGGGGTTELSGTITTTGVQSYADDVTLTGATTLASSGNAAIMLGGTVDGAHGLIVNTGGATVFDGAVTIASLATNAGGLTAINDGTVTTTGSQTYGDAVSLGADTVLTGTNGSFASTITGNGNDLTLSFSGTTTLSAGASGLAMLTSDGGGSTVLNGAVTTTGAQTYVDAVTLASNVTLASSGGGAITLGGTVGGPRALTVNTVGTTTLGGAVNIASLATNVDGSTAINGGTVTTTGAQTYGDAVTLGVATTLTSTGAGNISLNGTVAGAQSLVVNTVGTTRFGGSVSIAALTTDAGGSTQVNGASVATTGNQTYNDNVSIDRNTTFSGVDGTFNGTLTGNGTSDLTLSFSGVTSLTSVSNIEDLLSDAGGTTLLNGNVSTTGGQTYADAVTLGAAVTLASSGNGAITLASSVGGAQALIVNTGGATTFGGAVNIASLATDAGGATAINGGTVTTSGNQSYGDAVTLGADTTLTGATGTFASTVTGNGNDLALIFSGPTIIDGNFTGIDNLSSAGGGTTQLSGTIATTGSQIFSDDVTLAAATVLTSSGNAAVTLGGAVTGAQDLTVNTGGTTTFAGAVNIGALATDAGGTSAINGGSVTTTGAQGYGDNVTLGADTALISSGGGNIALGGTVTGPRALTVNTAGTTSFAGAVSIASLVTDAPGATQIDGGSIATTGDQTYGDPVTLGAHTILSGEDLSFASIAGGGNDLALNFSGTTAINGPLVTDVRNLSSGGGGTTSLSGAINTTGTQTYTDAVILVADTTLTSSGNAAIMLGSAVSGAQSLTVNTGGTTTFGGAVNIAALTTDAGGTTAINGGSVITSGAQTYNDMVTLGAATSLSGSAATFSALTGGGNDLTLAFTGAIDINGDFTGLDDLVASGATIDFAGQTLSGAGAASLTSSGTLTGGSLSFGGNVSASGSVVTLAGVTSTNGDVVLSAAGDLSVTDLAAGDDATLTAGGNLNLGNPAQVVDDLALTADDFLGVALTTPFAVGFGDDLTITDTAGGLTLGALTAPGTLTVTVQAGGGLDVGGTLTSTNESIALSTVGGGDIALNADVVTGTAAGRQVSLVSSGAISQNPAFGITTNTLTGSAVGAATLTGINQVTNLASFSAAGFTLVDAGGLTVTGAVSGGAAGVSLDTSGDLLINSSIDAAGGTATLTADGNIVQNASGVVLAALLTGSSGGATNLGVAANQVDVLGTFVANGFSLRDGAGGLMVNGAVDAGSGNLSLRVDSGPLLLAANLIAAGMVDLDALNGSITQVAGAITANALTGQSVGGATMDSAGNAFNVLAGFTNSGSGGITLFDTVALTVTAPVDAGPGALDITSAGLDFRGQTLTAGTDATLDAGANALRGGTVIAGGNVTGTAGLIDIDVANASGGALTLTAATGDLRLGIGTAGGTAMLTAPNGDVTVTTSLQAAGDVTVLSGGDALLGIISSTGGLIDVDAANAMTATSLSAAGTIDVDAQSIAIAGAANAGGDLLLDASLGGLSLGSGSAGGVATLRKIGGAGELQVSGLLTSGAAATIESNTNARLGSVSTTNGQVMVTAAGEVTGIGATGAANLSAGGMGNDVTVTAGPLARLGTVSAADAITVTADMIAIGSATATTGSLTLAADNGSLTLGSGSAGTTAMLMATDDATISGALNAGGTVTVMAGTDMGDLATAGSITSSGGDVIVSGAGIAIGSASASGLLDLDASAGDLSLGTGVAGTTADLDATGDVTVTTSLIAGGTVTIDAGGLADLGLVRSTGSSITVNAASIDAGTTEAQGGTLVLTASNGDLTLGTGSAATTAALATTGGSGDVTVTSGLSSGTGSTVSSVGDARLASVSAASGDVAAIAAGEVTGLLPNGRANLSAAAAGGDVTVTGGTLALLGTVIAGQNISVAADAVDIGSANATGGSLTLSADMGRLILGSGSAGTDALLTKQGVVGELQVGTLTAGGMAMLDSSTNARLGDITGSGDLAVTAGGQVTGIGAGARANLIAQADGSDLDVTAGGLVRLGQADAGNDLSVVSGLDGIDIITATARTGSLALSATNGDILLGGGTAAGNATLTTTGSGDIAVTNALLSGGAMAIDAVGALDAGTLDANGLIDAKAASIGIGTSDAGTSLTLLARSGQFTLETGAAGTTASLTKQGGTGELQVATLDAGGMIAIASATSARLGDVTSAGGDISVTAAGEVTGIGTGGRGNLVAAADTRDVTVAAGTLVRLGEAAAGNDLRVTASAGGIDIDDATARTGLLALSATGGDLRIGTGLAATTADLTTTSSGDIDVDTSLIAGGNVTIGSAGDATMALVRSTSGSIVVDAVGALQAGTLEASGLIDADAASIDIGTAVAGGALSITARSGQLTLGTGSAGDSATIIKQGASGELQITNALTAGADATLDSATSVRVPSVVSSSGNIAVTAGGAVTGVGEGARANLTANADAADVTVTAGTDVLIDAARAGNDLRVTAANGAIDIVSAAARTGLLALAATNGDIRLDTAEAATTSDLTTSGSGSIAIATSLASGGNVAITAADDIQAGTVTAGGSLAATGESIATGTASSGTTFAMTARSGQLTLGTGTAGSTATLTKQGSVGELQVTSLNAAGTATLTSSTSQRLGSVSSSGGDTLVTAANSVTGLAGSDFTGADLSANGRVQVRAGAAGLVRLSDVAATNGDVDVQAGTGAGTTSQVEILDAVSARTGYRILAGSIALGGDSGTETQAAGGAVDLTALSGAITGGAGLTLQSNSDGSGAEAVTIMANGAGGNVAFAADSRILGGTASGGSDVTVDTLGRATLGQVTATGRTIAISSNDIELQGLTASDLSPRVTASTVTITNRADVAGVTRLGDNAGSGGFAMSQAEVNRIGAATATIESGAQDVAIGNLSLVAGAGSTRLNIQGVSRFDVTGSVSAEGSAGSRTIQLGGHAADALTASNVRQATIIRVAAMPQGGGRLLMGAASLDLRGAKIGVGQDDNFLSAIGLAPGGTPLGLDAVAQQFISNPNSTLYSAAIPYGEASILTANKLMVTYNDYALFQNSGIAFVPPSGVTIASLGANGTLDLFSSGDTAPNGFALFGVINGREGNEAALLGPEVIRLTDTNRNNTRINGCAVGSGGGGCLISAVGTPNVAVFDERQANILNTADDLELPFDPIVGTNNEALFTGISSIDEVMDEPEIDCSAEPDAPECRDDESAPEDEAEEAPTDGAPATVEPDMASEDAL